MGQKMTDQAISFDGMMGHNSGQFRESQQLHLVEDTPEVSTEELETRLYCYEFLREQPLGVERGEIDAADEAEAGRLIRIRYMMGVLPEGARIYEKPGEDHGSGWSISEKLRFLLKTMVSHHHWLAGRGGQRADLSNLDLREVNVAGRNMSHADFNETDLSNTDLSKAVLIGANMRGANLKGANLCGADLSGVDLTDANLCGAMLIGAKLDGVDLWRANLSGCAIAPKKLHNALRCRLTR
jgi:hypothetical protein